MRIQVCPKNPGFPIQSYDLGMGFSTINPINKFSGGVWILKDWQILSEPHSKKPS